MKKTSKAFSITLILAIMLLACLLIYSLGSTGAWFTTTGSNIKFTLNVSGADIYVYQEIDGEDIKLDSSKQQYISVEQEIVPNVEVPLILKVKNNEASGSYLRFKIEVLAVGLTETEIPVRLNYDEVSTSSNGFKPYSDGYFCYEKHENNLAVGETAQQTMTGELELISGFTIEETDFVDKQLNGNTIKIVITVECSDINWYAE